jgi:hypothetical protein
MAAAATRLFCLVIVVYLVLSTRSVHPWMTVTCESLIELASACMLYCLVRLVGYTWTVLLLANCFFWLRVGQLVVDHIKRSRALIRHYRFQLLMTVANDAWERLQWQRWLLLAHAIKKQEGGKEASAKVGSVKEGSVKTSATFDPHTGAFLIFGLLRLGLKHAHWHVLLARPSPTPEPPQHSVPHWPHQRRSDVELLVDMASALALPGTPRLTGCLRCAVFIFRASRCVVMEGTVLTVPSDAFDKLVRRTLTLASLHFPNTKAAVFVCEVAKHARSNVSCGRRALTKRVCA